MSFSYSPPKHSVISESSLFPVGTALPVSPLPLVAAQPATNLPIITQPTAVAPSPPCSRTHCTAPSAHPYPPRIYINGIPSSLGDYSEASNVEQPTGQSYFDCDVSHDCVTFDTASVATWLRTSPLQDRLLLVGALQILADHFHQDISAEPRQSTGLLLVNDTPIPLLFRITSAGLFRLAWVGGEMPFVRQRHHSSPPASERLVPPGESRTLVGNPGGPRFADGIWGVVTVTHTF